MGETKSLNERLKQRLIGAAVLVSLAVIFIPALLDGEGDRGSAKPPEPDYRFEPLEIPLQEPPARDQAVTVIDKPDTPEPADKPAEGDQPVALRQPTASEPAQPEPAPPPPVAPPPVDPGTDNATGPSAWVVQVGSFSESANALALRDKLRQQGFTAFVEKVGASQGTVYRVRVGPELKREAAEALKNKLEKKLELSGIVMPHP